MKDYYDYYKTARGYHPRSLNSNGGWNKTGCMSFLNQPILCYADEIRSAVLVMHGEKAHSCYFSRDAFAKLTGEDKELLIIPDANNQFVPCLSAGFISLRTDVSVSTGRRLCRRSR